MINIYTYSEDQSYHSTVDWIDYKDQQFEIIKSEEFYASKTIKIPSNREFLKRESSNWFRKWKNPGVNANEIESYKMQLNSFYLMQNKDFWLNKPNDLLAYKGVQLQVASSNGFNVPNTIITKDKAEISCFLNEHKKCIIKSNDTQTHINNKELFINYSKILNFDLLEKIEIKTPCIVQKYIEKEVEIRTFFLMDNCFSMAIFSQNDDQTMVDYRRYNHDRPNRLVPFNLPNEIEQIIRNFMEQMDLNCGSLDIILTPDQDYVFLEVNPFGQFGMVSFPCNYYLEEKIADNLIKELNKNENPKKKRDQ